MAPRPTITTPAAGPTQDDALAANRAFYHAFSTRDFAAMEMLWAQNAPIMCIHPGWPPLADRVSVLSSLRDIMRNPETPKAFGRSEKAFIFGITAVVICEEVLEGGVLAATNIFVNEGGAWRMVHHQASSIAAPIHELPLPRNVLH
ncbi:nuclear transport factor 2 family protein [Skermanella pratensis]|uniref:nuclear transport factor 2 family protein n=1 Tax=Skermanella pratensis TaxID=2233999 RepID=UPI00130154CC|nr:nuclear transport factor 2 family protein [Skermanella pratensis]